MNFCCVILFTLNCQKKKNLGKTEGWWNICVCVCIYIYDYDSNYSGEDGEKDRERNKFRGRGINSNFISNILFY